MFKLTQAELDAAFQAIEHHGFSALLPTPIEWKTVRDHWPEFRTFLQTIDLRTYTPYQPLTVYAPKSRYMLRVVKLLHPQDLILYTALILILKNEIEGARDPVSRKRVFSFRSDVTISNQLYQADGSYERYRARLRMRAKRKTIKFVALADISDFYPRIYQHRLENSLQAVASGPRSTEAAKLLINRLASVLAKGRSHGKISYGVPVGPLASRLLAEATLLDVDAALALEEFDFVRWVDDFNFFCASEAEAQHCLFFLAEWLFEHHGLTLQPSKTKVIPVAAFSKLLARTHEARVKARAAIVYELARTLKSAYDESSTVSLTAEEMAEVESVPLKAELGRALNKQGRRRLGTRRIHFGKASDPQWTSAQEEAATSRCHPCEHR